MYRPTGFGLISVTLDSYGGPSNSFQVNGYWMHRNAEMALDRG
jgi:hypothetical protein